MHGKNFVVEDDGKFAEGAVAARHGRVGGVPTAKAAPARAGDNGVEVGVDQAAAVRHPDNRQTILAQAGSGGINGVIIEDGLAVGGAAGGPIAARLASGRIDGGRIPARDIPGGGTTVRIPGRGGHVHVQAGELAAIPLGVFWLDINGAEQAIGPGAAIAFAASGRAHAVHEEGVFSGGVVGVGGAVARLNQAAVILADVGAV